VYVADSRNHRVLRFDPPLSNGQHAALVLGQPDFASNQEADYCFNSGTPDPSGTPFVCLASGVAASRQGAVWVVNTAGSFAVRFTRPETSFQRSDVQIGGQTDGGPLSLGGSCVVFTLCEPRAIATDAQGAVWIADTAKRRVVRFVAGPDVATQDLVIGRPNPGTGQNDIQAALECEIAVRPDNVCFPEGVTIDPSQRILVADTQHHRVLRFDPPATNFPSANLVIGQPDFTSGGDTGCTETSARGPG
jgi:sugar lactone lactonase YvrE